MEINNLELKLGTFDEKVKLTRKNVTSFKIADMNETMEIPVKNAIISDMLTTGNEFPIRNENIKNLEYLKEVTLQELDTDDIGIILSSNFAKFFFGHDAITSQNKNEELFAVKSAFGWCVMGPLDNDIDNDARMNALNDDETLSIDTLIRQMYRHDFVCRPEEEFPSEIVHMSQYDEYSLDQIRQSIYFDKNTKHYSTALPWKFGRKEAAKAFSQVNTYSYARNRQDRLKMKLEKDPETKKMAFTGIRHIIEQGFATIIPDHSAPPNSPVCYLANHLATHPDKPGKVRVTQDAAGTVKGQSLNKHLLGGPDMLNNLVGILLRFRRKKIVLSADIKDFFYQIRVNPIDRPAIRFLWWTDETMQEEMILEGACHLFGLASSPCVSNIVLQYHAMKNREKIDVDTFLALLIQFYVDDFLHSVDHINDAKRIKNQLTEFLATAGFKLLKWRSNFPELNDNDSPNLPNQATNDQKVDQDNRRSSPTGRDGEGRYSPNSRPTNEGEEEEENETSDEEEQLSSFIKEAFSEEQHQVDGLRMTLDDNPKAKVLGVGYSFETDELFVRVPDKLDREVLTKRDVLSFVCSMFDPLGILAPYILKGRIHFQTTNLIKIQWKEKVPDDILKRVNKWKKNVKELRKLKIPRWTNTPDIGLHECKLIIFCDASSVGYGMCAYIRRKAVDNGNIHVSFLSGKAHVVPLAMMQDPVSNQEPHLGSIPRLELSAAKLAAVWRDILLRESGETFDDIILFSDSQTILGWIGDWNKKFRTYEHFRLKKIRLLSKVNEWRYVRTNLNPADLVSKGLDANETEKWNLYLYGPSFLSQNENEWPKPPENKNNEEAINALYVKADMFPIQLACVNATTEEPEIEDDEEIQIPWAITSTRKLSDWSKKVRRIAIIEKCAKIWLKKIRPSVNEKTNNDDALHSSSKTKNETKTHNYNLRLRERNEEQETKNENEKNTLTSDNKIYLKLEEKKRAEEILLKAIQKEHFDKEITRLHKLGVFQHNAFEEMKKDSKGLTSLTPFIDKNGLMRAGGRLGKSKTIPYESRHPIILPDTKNEIMQSFVRHHHDRFHCSSTETFYLIRKKYFLIGGKNSVKAVTKKCVNCQKAAKLPTPQKMGELPQERVSIAAPFSTSGLDVFGPFEVKTGRITKKRYVLLITCFITRGVALYPLPDMTLDSVVYALLKCHSQFPSLKKLVSDNGTNFKGANREIQEAIKSWNENEINDKLSENGLEWSFGPANCGHFGGLWERMVGITKNAMKACMNRKTLSIDAFDALCASTAGIMNRRPLTRATNDINEMTVLSPAHFIYPYNEINSSTNIVPPIPESGESLRSAWNEVREILDIYWERWRKEYLTTLIQRKKWNNTRNDYKIGDIVLLTDDIQPREKWRITRIAEIKDSEDERQRRYILEDTFKNKFDRHRDSIVHLELY